MVVTAAVAKTADNTADLIQALQYLRDTEILVGVPEKNTARKDDPITNAQLLYIHTQGIRKRAMRKRMDEILGTERGMKYSKAFDLYIRENGSPLWHSPPRPVLAPSIESVQDRITEQMGKAAAAAMDGDIKETRARIRATGQVAQDAARGWLDVKNLAPNSPRTIRMKGSDRPLVNTGGVQKAIVYVVQHKGADQLT